MAISTLLQDKLTAMQGRVANRYTPLEFRNFLNVQTVVPPWAKRGEFFRIDTAADIKLVTALDTGVPLASHTSDSRTFNIYEFANGLEFKRKDVQHAEQDPGWPLPDVLGLANQRVAEYTQEELAMKGTYKGAALGGCEGILTLADATDGTALVTSTDTWVSAAGLVVQSDPNVIMGLFDEIMIQYKGLVGGGLAVATCIIPQWQAKALTARPTGGGDMVLTQLRAAYPAINFVVSSHADAAAGAGIDRFAFFPSDEDVHVCVIPEEYHELPALEGPLQSVFVPSVMSAGGVISNFPTAVIYVDLDRADEPS